MYNQELGDWLDSVIRKLEIKATLPPRICWNGEMKLGSVMSVSQSSAQVFDVATQSDIIFDQGVDILQTVIGG